eukprot:COSAG06_NODE_46679_length_345_cov_0.630081_1_plen_44_part_01
MERSQFHHRGKEIKFSTDITATHRHVRRDCKLISPCGQADISGD